MHIPDGFLNLPVVGLTGVAATLGVSLSFRKTFNSESSSTVTKMGIPAAVIFTAQMLNYPVNLGTSGHILGAAMAAIFLGPFRTTLILTSVLMVQCFLFHDGGFTTLGANVFNMALVGVWSSWIAYHLMGGSKRPFWAAAVAGFVSVETAALACSAELALSHTAPVAAIFSGMLSVHGLIGLSEGIVTGCMIYFARRSPSMGTFRLPTSWVQVAPLFVVMLILVPFACGWPDGLEFVASRLGFESHALPSFFPSLEMSLGSPVYLVSVAAAVFGVAVVAGIWGLLAKLNVRV
jgi:cobalt/nickel transport system permease protein